MRMAEVSPESRRLSGERTSLQYAASSGGGVEGQIPTSALWWPAIGLQGTA